MSNCVYKVDNEVITFLLPLTKILPNHFDLHYTLANAYRKNYQNELALEYYLKAELIDYERVNFLDLAVCYRYLQKYAEAIPYYLKAEKSQPQNETIVHELGLCFRETEQYQLCIDYYLKADKLKPNNTWYLGNIGWCYQQLKNYTEGLRYHLRCEEINAHDSWNLDNIAYCYQRTYNYDKAFEYYDKSLNINRENVWTYGQIGWCNIVLGNLSEAKNAFEQAIKTKQDMSEYALMNVGHVYLYYQKMDKALKFYQKSALKYKTEAEFIKDFEDDYQYVGKWGKISLADYQQIKKELLEYRHTHLKNT